MTPRLEATVALPPRLAQLRLSAIAGERVAVVGPNGSGKTSLLRALAGIERDAGEVLVDGEPLHHTAPARRRKLLSFLPAARDVAWPIPVRDVIALGLDQRNEARIAELLAALDLAALAERPIDTLSTGERARALLARALAPKPRLLLLDEPLSNLDPAWALRILDLLEDAASDGTAILLALHDLNLLPRFTRVLLMARGERRADTEPQALLGSDLFGEVFGVEPAGNGWRLMLSEGPQS